MSQNNISQQAMEKSLDALWLKMRVHTNNISNYETPDYKAKKVQFNEVFDSACARKTSSTGGNVGFKLNVTQDVSTESRVDGNNVDMENEQIELWKAQTQYAALVQKVSGKYRNISTVINAIR